MNLPPIAWRHGEGYIHPEELPPPPPPAAPFLFFPSLPGFWGPPPPYGFSGFATPPMFPFPPPTGFWGPPPPPLPAAPASPPNPAKAADKKKDDTPDEYKLPGGLLPGSVHHYQDGKKVYIHDLGVSATDLKNILEGTHDGLISKHIHEFNENTSVETVMRRLKGATMTQVFEKGGGEFQRGTSWTVGKGESGKTLKECGWGGAGAEKGAEPIWVFVERKGGK
ncbi:hypothetical protein EG327_002508 [Venturia inaequalis]|uniref:Uncharacterized protein n=1 Tax=Venturia inaequalis TaxID=5025 RepID=A0A8H3Z8K5_VENIN|nr:hypothetical protein EG327_002508 [Venturia inaequalis]